MVAAWHTMSLRLTKDTYELIAEASSAREESHSSFIRRAILKELAKLSFLPSSRKKALGMGEVGE